MDPNAVIAATLLVVSAVSLGLTVLAWLLAREDRRAAAETVANVMTRRSFLVARRFSLSIVTGALLAVTLFVGYVAVYMPA